MLFIDRSSLYSILHIYIYVINYLEMSLFMAHIDAIISFFEGCHLFCSSFLSQPLSIYILPKMYNYCTKTYYDSNSLLSWERNIYDILEWTIVEQGLRCQFIYVKGLLIRSSTLKHILREACSFYKHTLTNWAITYYYSICMKDLFYKIWLFILVPTQW